MPEFFSYSIQDFIPFNSDAYFSIFAAQSSDYFPLQILFSVLAILAIFSINKSLTLRLLSVGATLIFTAFVAWDFFGDRYSMLNWASEYFSWAFWALGVILAGTLLGASGKIRSRFSKTSASILLAVSLLYPILGTFHGRLEYAEFIGFSPDPTAIFLLGIIILRGGLSYFASPIALVWLCISAATFHTLEINRWILIAPLVVLFLVAMLHNLWEHVEGLRSQTDDYAKES